MQYLDARVYEWKALGHFHYLVSIGFFISMIVVTVDYLL